MARPEALLEPAKAARPMASAKPAERMAERPIRQRSYPLVFNVHHILIENLRVPSRRQPDSYAAEATARIALREFAARSDRVARAEGLTAERYELLLLIKIAGDGEATVGNLARRLH